VGVCVITRSPLRGAHDMHECRPATPHDKLRPMSFAAAILRNAFGLLDKAVPRWHMHFNVATMAGFSSSECVPRSRGGTREARKAFDMLADSSICRLLVPESDHLSSSPAHAGILRPPNRLKCCRLRRSAGVSELLRFAEQDARCWPVPTMSQG
jgi:hypothetical protein